MNDVKKCVGSVSVNALMEVSTQAVIIEEIASCPLMREKHIATVAKFRTLTAAAVRESE